MENTEKSCVFVENVTNGLSQVSIFEGSFPNMKMLVCYCSSFNDIRLLYHDFVTL